MFINLIRKATRHLWILIFFAASGCNAMNKFAPEKYFHGTQLTMAQSIESGNVTEVKNIATDVNLNQPGAQDMTLLFFAVQCAKDRSQHQLDIIRELVRAGADPLQEVPDLGSVAEVSATSPYPVYMQALLEGGMSPNAKVKDRPVFFRAASDNTISTLALMVKKGANINQGDSLGRPVLMHALDGMQLDTVEWLLNQGANPNAIETNTGWSFMRQLDDTIKFNNGQKGATLDKLMEILQLAKEKGGHD